MIREVCQPIAQGLSAVGNVRAKTGTSAALRQSGLPAAVCGGKVVVAARTDLGFKPKVHITPHVVQREVIKVEEKRKASGRSRRPSDAYAGDSDVATSARTPKARERSFREAIASR
jgi:hypothetical protein